MQGTQKQKKWTKHSGRPVDHHSACHLQFQVAILGEMWNATEGATPEIHPLTKFCCLYEAVTWILKLKYYSKSIYNVCIHPVTYL